MSGTSLVLLGNNASHEPMLTRCMFKGLITVGRKLRQQHPSDLLSGAGPPRERSSRDVPAGQQITRASMGPTWVLSAPEGPHFGPMNLAFRECINWFHFAGLVVLMLWKTKMSQNSRWLLIMPTDYCKNNSSLHIFDYLETISIKISIMIKVVLDITSYYRSKCGC